MLNTSTCLITINKYASHISYTGYQDKADALTELMKSNNEVVNTAWGKTVLSPELSSLIRRREAPCV